MRRTSPQNKLERSGTGQSGSSPRVTLRLNQVRNTRDYKKTSGTVTTSRQSSSSAASHMEAAIKSCSGSSGSSSSTISSSVNSTTGLGASSGNAIGNAGPAVGGGGGGGAGSAASEGTSAGAAQGAGAGPGGNGNSASTETGDVYEFKSSKEATPVRGTSCSPNPEKEQEKEKEPGGTGSGNHQEAGNIATATASGGQAVQSETITGSSGTLTMGTGGNDSHAGIVGSPSAKRPYESADNTDEQADDEIRRKKRKDSEATNKDSGGKGQGTGRQNLARNATSANDKLMKSGKQSGSSGGVSSSSVPSSMSLKSNNQSANSTSADRKSPGGTPGAASASPKAQNTSSSSGTNSKTSTPAPPESDGEDDRPKSSDSASAPKVPPLKIVIPQSTTSEQEVGARNGKNTSNRNHQLPYVVPSSNSNDSTEKDQALSASGTTSPIDTPNVSKTEEKKDFSGVLHGEERSTHHQRVLRSSHRSGNGGNGSSSGAKDGSGGSGSSSGNYANASAISAAAIAPATSNSSTSAVDRSSNSSPQQLQQQQQPLQAQQQQQHHQQQQDQQQQQQRHNSPSPETTTNAESNKTSSSESNSGNNGSGNNAGTGNGSGGSSNNSGTGNSAKTGATMSDRNDKYGESSNKVPKQSSDSNEPGCSYASTSSSSASHSGASGNAPVELHPRKRKMKSSKEAQQAAASAASAAANDAAESTSTGSEVHPHDQPITNCYQEFLNIRKQIERRRKGLFPVQPKPPQGFKDYLMNRCTYVLAGNSNKEPNINPPATLQAPAMKELYATQEKERHRLRMQHVVEKEKLVLSVEQEILRVHGRAARALANQSVPFSACTILKDEEVYNVITPEQEEKDRNARSRYNGRLFLSWLQDVDDKWEKIKESMLLRHHNEAESLYAVQKMDWEWKLKEVGLCEFKATPQIDDLHVPMVHVSDDFDLLPA